MKTIKIYSDLHQVEKMYVDFESEINSAVISSSYKWLKKWVEIFKDDIYTGANKQFIIVVVIDDNKKVISIAPFMISKQKYASINLLVLQFMGQTWGATYCDILSKHSDPKQIDLIINAIKSQFKFDLIWLNHIPSFSLNFNAADLFPYQVCPEIKLKGFESYKEYTSTRYSKNLKQNLRTSYNRAVKNGDQLFSKTEKHSLSIFNRIVEIAKTKLRDHKDFKYSDPLKTRFRKEIMNEFVSNVTTVYVNETIVAYRTNIIYNSTKYCFEASYDRDYPKYNLGIISVDTSIEDSFKRKLDYHCEGPGKDNYKLKFSTQDVILNYFLMRGNTLASIIFFPVFKRLVKIKSNKFLETHEGDKKNK